MLLRMPDDQWNKIRERVRETGRIWPSSLHEWEVHDAHVVRCERCNYGRIVRATECPQCAHSFTDTKPEAKQPTGDAERLYVEIQQGAHNAKACTARLNWTQSKLYVNLRQLCETGRIEVSKRPGRQSVYRTIESSQAGKA